MSDIEGKSARVAVSERGQRTSFKIQADRSPRRLAVDQFRQAERLPYKNGFGGHRPPLQQLTIASSSADRVEQHGGPREQRAFRRRQRRKSGKEND